MANTNMKLALDVVSNVATTIVQFGDPLPEVIGPFVVGDVIYTGAIKAYVDAQFGGNEGLTDEFTRDVVFKSICTGLLIYIANEFTAGPVGVVDGTLNAVVSYLASNGLQDVGFRTGGNTRV